MCPSQWDVPGCPGNPGTLSTVCSSHRDVPGYPAWDVLTYSVLPFWDPCVPQQLGCPGMSRDVLGHSVLPCLGQLRMPWDVQDTTFISLKGILGKLGTRCGSTGHVCNGPQYASQAFENFAQSYGFQHLTSSPPFPQSSDQETVEAI